MSSDRLGRESCSLFVIEIIFSTVTTAHLPLPYDTSTIFSSLLILFLSLSLSLFLLIIISSGRFLLDFSLSISIFTRTSEFIYVLRDTLDSLREVLRILSGTPDMAKR